MDYVNWIIIPLLIFLSRIIDVSIGTLRLIFISKGYKLIAATLGFIEITIWLIVIRQVMGNMDNIASFLAYGLGFATGNYVGMIIDEKVSMGKVMIRIVTNKDATYLKTQLDATKFNFTSIDGEGKHDFSKVFFSVVQRKHVPKIISIVHEHNPKASYSVQDVRFANDDEPSPGLFSTLKTKMDSLMLFRLKKAK